MNKIKQVPSATIKRSLIKFASYNPRKLSEDAKKRLKANLKRIGLAGGVVWNEATGNLVSGHQKVSIIDQVEGYNPATGENDYEIRVEVLNLSEKEEKEQNVFFNSRTAQGEFDNDLLAAILPEIDIQLAGLDESDVNILMADVPVFDIAEYNEAVKKDFEDLEFLSDRDRDERKRKMKEAKAETAQKMVDEADGEPYVILSFQSYANKVAFMEFVGELLPDAKIMSSDKYIKGEYISDLLNG